MLCQRLALFSLAWIVSFCPAQAQIEPLDQKFKNQQSDREKTLEICKKQYAGAAYLYSREKSDKGVLAPSPVFSHEIDTDGFRFMVTSRGVQGISPSVVQQSSGKWKCERGSIESPMVLGKEYSKTRPLYMQTSSPPGCRPFVRPCSKKLIGYETSRRMVKDEECGNGLRCLVLYRNIDSGKTSRHIIGVSLKSIQALFPYDERVLFFYAKTSGDDMHEVRIGPDGLKCSAYYSRHGREESHEWKAKNRARMRDRYVSCLQSKALELFEK